MQPDASKIQHIASLIKKSCQDKTYFQVIPKTSNYIVGNRDNQYQMVRRNEYQDFNDELKNYILNLDEDITTMKFYEYDLYAAGILPARGVERIIVSEVGALYNYKAACDFIFYTPSHYLTFIHIDDFGQYNEL